jgi:F0F1-type ATP synthase assembly protein I
MPSHRPNRRQLGRLARSSAVGLEMGISVVVGLLGGRWLDGKAGTAPWLMLAGLLVGVIAGFRGLMRVANEARARAKAQDAETERQESRKP